LGNAHVTLDPGTYEIAGGGFVVSNNATVSGSGVLIYNAGSAFPKAGGSFGGVNFSGTSSVNLTGPATGSYAGVILFQSRDNTTPLLLSGSAMLGTGMVYAPSAVLYLSGSSNLAGPLIVDQLWLTDHADPSPVLPERTAGSTNDAQWSQTVTETAPAPVARSSTALDLSGAATALPSDFATVGSSPGGTILSAASISVTPLALSPRNGAIMTSSAPGPSERLSGGATGRSGAAQFIAHDSLFDRSRPGDEMEPWWPQRADDSLVPQPEPARTLPLQELVDKAVVALPPAGYVGEAAAVDAIIAASERARPEGSASVLKASSVNWREGYVADRIAAWLAGLTLFGWCQARTCREEPDDKRPRTRWLTAASNRPRRKSCRQ
jgi:hypothetical protein